MEKIVIDENIIKDFRNSENYKYIASILNHINNYYTSWLYRPGKIMIADLDKDIKDMSTYLGFINRNSIALFELLSHLTSFISDSSNFEEFAITLYQTYPSVNKKAPNDICSFYPILYDLRENNLSIFAKTTEKNLDEIKKQTYNYFRRRK